MFDAYSKTNVSWGASVDPCPDYLPRSPVNPCDARRHVRSDLLLHRRQERLWFHYNWRNPLINPRVHCRDKDRDGPIIQYFFQNPR